MLEAATEESRAKLSPAAPSAGGRRPARRWRISWPRWASLVFGILMICLWQVSSNREWIDPLFVSSPIDIAKAAGTLSGDSDFQTALLETVKEFFLGFALSAVLGVLLGLVAGWWWQVREFTAPFVAALYATPRIAVLPLFVLWFGVDVTSRVAFIVSLAALPVFINTVDGIRVVDPALIRVSRNFGASQMQIFRTVAIPAAVPQIISGLRVAVSLAILAVVTAEFFIGDAGIGYLLQLYGNAFRTPELMVAVVASALLGIAALVPLNLLERHFEYWRPGR